MLVAACGGNLGVEGALSLLSLLLLLLLWPAEESENGQHQLSNCFFLCTVIRLALSLYLATSFPYPRRRPTTAARHPKVPRQRVPVLVYTHPFFSPCIAVCVAHRERSTPRHVPNACGAESRGGTKRYRKRL